MSNTTTEDKLVIRDSATPTTFTICVVYSGEDVLIPPEVHTPGRSPTRIGRHVESGILLARDPRLSRVHAELHREPMGTLRLVDMKSRNGTFVNGLPVPDQRLAGGQLLADGDVIAMGDSYLVVRQVPPDLRDASVPSLVGISPAIRKVRAALADAGPMPATVLLLAESGCGKEVAANALHELSGRDGPFIPVNCSAIPESLAESQFFGHVKNAFTGAEPRPGLFRAAHGGTLFLDEVGDLPLAIQPKLLRALEERAVLPVGATATVPFDARIVAATNRDLPAAIEEQRFRGDLYARLAQVEVRLPPLRDRREDVLLLLVHALGSNARPLTSRLAEALLRYPWPFNVREVFSIAQQLRLRPAGAGPFDLPLVADRLGAGALPTEPVSRPQVAPQPSQQLADTLVGDGGPVPDRAGLEALLVAHRGVVSDVARATRRSRKQVYRWIAEHGLDVDQYRGRDDG